MIDECVKPILDSLEDMNISLSERINKGEELIKNKEGDDKFIRDCQTLLNNLTTLRLQVQVCIDVLNDRMDLIAQEGNAICVARHMDDRAKEVINKAFEYCDVVVQREASPKQAVQWNTFFGGRK